MTPKAQRIAIAEACGWKWVRATAREMQLRNPANYLVLADYGDNPNLLDHWREVPNYLGDLNAMHEAEKVLTVPQVQYYVSHLWNLTLPYPDNNPFTNTKCHLTYMEAFNWIRPTAAQRAEAFLRAIGKWVDDEKKETGV